MANDVQTTTCATGAAEFIGSDLDNGDATSGRRATRRRSPGVDSEAEHSMLVTTQRVPRERPIFTPLSFRRLLEWLDDGVDSQGERYIEIRRRLVAYFDRRNRAAAEELADETLSRIGRTLEESGVIATTPALRYCYVVARFVLLEDIRRAQRYVHLDETRLDDVERAGRSDEADEGRATRERRLECLECCLRELPAAQRELVIEYYRHERGAKVEHRRNMAAQLGISNNALGIRAFRIRESLMAGVESCLRTKTPGRR